MQYMDQTGLYVMEDILQDLKVKGVDVVFIGLLDQPRYMMERIKIIPNLVAENQIYKNFENYLKRLS
jgi:SulP family sulfate permease